MTPSVSVDRARRLHPTFDSINQINNSIILSRKTFQLHLAKQPSIPTKKQGCSTFHSGGIAMTELRKRMIECLPLAPHAGCPRGGTPPACAGLSARTQESYVRAVRQLAEHYHKSPDLITEEELRQYFLYLNEY
jgi:hypothetical protein